MSGLFDLTDVPAVSGSVLQGLVEIMVAEGHAKLLFHGVNDDARASIEQAFWDRHAGSTAEGVAALLRFWALVDAFRHRRIAGLLFARGHGLLSLVARAAADLRVNANWGFNPQKLLWAVDALEAQLRPAADVKPLAAHRAQTAYQPLGLAA